MPSADRAWTMLGGSLVSAAFFGLFGKVLRPAVKALRESVARLGSALDAAEAAAWEQMEPLNRLFDWGLPAEIAHRTLPRIEFDPLFTAGRLRDLRETFGLDDELLGSRSVLGTASGEISGNPFVLADTLAMRWTTKTYHGSLDISWSELERGADGKLHRVPKSETLHGSKPEATTKPSSSPSSGSTSHAPARRRRSAFSRTGRTRARCSQR